MDPSGLKTEPSRKTAAATIPAIPSHRHSNPVRRIAQEIDAVSEVMANTTGTRPCSWLSASTAAGWLLSPTLTNAVSAAVDTNPIAINRIPDTRTATATGCWPACHTTGTSPASTAMKASSANPTAISLASSTPR